MINPVTTLITVDRKKFLHNVEMLHKRDLETVERKFYNNMCNVDEIILKIAEYYNKCTVHNLEYVEPVFRCAIQKEIIGGYCVINGELVSLWSEVKGLSKWLVQNAIFDGAKRLDCFAWPHLIKIYSEAGFIETSRVANWTPHGPDVIYMNLKQKKPYNPLA